MLPVSQPLQEHEILPVFLVALIGIPGKSTEHGPDHKAVGDQRQQGAGKPAEETADQANDQTGGQDQRVQLIRAVSSVHKFPKAHGQLHTELTEPISKTIHRQITC